MRQSQTYRRKQGSDYVMDPSRYSTYRNGMAWRILRKQKGRLTPYEAWQLAAVPAFFLWAFRGPVSFFKRRRADRMLRRRLKSNNKPSKHE